MSAQSPPVPVAARSLRRPLTKRLRPAHWVALDYLLAAWCAVIIFGTMAAATGPGRLPVTGWGAHYWLPALLTFCLSIPVAIRRRDPVISLAMVLVAGAAVLALGGQITPGPFVPLAIVLYLVAATRTRTAAALALAASLALIAVQGLVLHLAGTSFGDAIAAGLVLITCWMIGYSVGQRRAYAARLRRQIADNAVTQERLRIARELHDVVAHSMTVVAVQAGFGEYVFDRQPAQARAALGAIQTVTTEALADMQRMLGALRQAAPRTGPQARWARQRAPRWHPRPAWLTWTGWWPARQGPVSRWRCSGPGRPEPSRPVSTPPRSASSRRR